MRAKLKNILGHEVFVINQTSSIIKVGKELAKDKPFSLIWQYDHNKGLFNLIFIEGNTSIYNATNKLKYAEGLHSYKYVSKRGICIVKLTPEAMSILELD